jgi:polyvinyl alcohol dehydrogenase (cytochrome)
MFAKPPSYYGDVLFGGAADNRKAYFALQETAAITAINLQNGKKAWSHPFKPVSGRSERPGFGAAVSLIPGVVFSGGWDGVLHALDSEDGHEIWSFDTVKSYKTINGVIAKGGSMGAPGSVIADGMLYVGSGYVGVSNGIPGNVLLAFAP